MDTTVVYENSGWWFALAIVTAGLAESKGRGRWTWFVLGLLIGPLATALVVVWARPTDSLPSPAAPAPLQSSSQRGSAASGAPQ